MDGRESSTTFTHEEMYRIVQEHISQSLAGTLTVPMEFRKIRAGGGYEVSFLDHGSIRVGSEETTFTQSHTVIISDDSFHLVVARQIMKMVLNLDPDEGQGSVAVEALRRMGKQDSRWYCEYIYYDSVPDEGESFADEQDS